ncbi:hypothetical protein SDC9_152211 [bioreactor metagenome]|uniref:Uncharacterized protein n=1 Tax=bioreactor metagenome TaxID=1076179 RepID=A0A645EUQ8_9ZZZZ
MIGIGSINVVYSVVNSIAEKIGCLFFVYRFGVSFKDWKPHAAVAKD